MISLSDASSMLKTFPSLLFLTQDLSLSVETLLMRSENLPQHEIIQYMYQ